MTETSINRRKKSRLLTQEAFDLLLSSLDGERTRAAEKYEHLRRAMIIFFSCRGSANAEDLADETFNRVALRLSEGAAIVTTEPAAYFYGVARNIWREVCAQPITTEPLTDAFDERQIPPQYATPDALTGLLLDEQRAETERRLICLEKCLQKFSPENRELMVEYYEGVGGVKIARRQSLADRLGITLKTLRNKTTLLRATLTECLQHCLEALYH